MGILDPGHPDLHEAVFIVRVVFRQSVHILSKDGLFVGAGPMEHLGPAVAVDVPDRKRGNAPATVPGAEVPSYVPDCHIGTCTSERCNRTPSISRAVLLPTARHDAGLTGALAGTGEVRANL